MDSSEGTVLLVDDEDMVRHVTRRMLELGGYDVLEADSAAQALAVLQELHSAIQLLVSDIQMPGMSSVQLAEQIEGEWPGIPILLISGHAGEHAVHIKHPVLGKPFTMQALLRKVTEILGNAPHSGSL